MARHHRVGLGSVACQGGLTDYSHIFTAMQPLFNRLRSILDRMLQGAFPDDGHTPAKSLEHFRMAPVAIDISLEFLPPELLVGSGRGCVATAFVSMPEAAVDKHHRPMFREHKVGGARQLSDMKSIPESFGEKKGAKSPFRPSVFSSNARHHAAALRSGRDAHDLGSITPRCLQKPPSRTSTSQSDGSNARDDVWELSMRLIREKSLGGY